MIVLGLIEQFVGKQSKYYNETVKQAVPGHLA
jgi:hypothetical protein